MWSKLAYITDMQIQQPPQKQTPYRNLLKVSYNSLNNSSILIIKISAYTHLFFQARIRTMADANTEVPSVETAPASTAEKPIDKTVPVETTTGQAETQPAPEAPLAEPAPANKDEASTEPDKNTNAALDKEAKTQPPLGTEGTTDAKAADPADESASTKETTSTKTAFEQFDAKLPEILKDIGHDEMWGVKLVSPASSHVPTGIVIQKFLNANDGDLTKAIEQFTGALNFRKEKKPLDLVAKTFSANKFADLGAVTVYDVKDSSVPEVFTWNLYGNVKGKMDEVFVPLDEFVRPISSGTSFFSVKY